MGSTSLAVAGAVVFAGLNASGNHAGITGSYVLLAVIALVYAGAGALITARVAGNPIGPLLLGMGILTALGGFAEQYSLRALEHPGTLPAAGLAGWLANWTYTPLVAAIPIVLLLFPTGRPASRRWGWVTAASVVATAVGTLATMVYPGEVDGITNSLKDHGFHPTNPAGIPSAKAALSAILAVAGWVGLAAAVLAIVSIVLRARRAAPEEREQIKWLAFVALGIVVLFVVMITGPAYLGNDSGLETFYFVAAFGFALLGVPVAVAIAVLKYRLYDIDVVINKALVYTLLAAFITAVYVGIVVGLGAAIGQRSKQNLGLSILATAIVALAFQPVRARVQHLANRLVYGKRATPYEVLSAFAERAASAYATEDLLPRMARILAEGTGAVRAAVWLTAPGQLQPAAVWPASEIPFRPRAMDGPELPEISDVSLVLPVRHRGELLGALSMTKAPGDRIGPAEEKLARDLAAQAGLVLRNVRLIEDLRASRVRLVKAQDDERRRLERNIHDGAQQQLVALAVKLGLARQVLPKDREKGDAILVQLQGDAQEALEDLRDLARGIYPPLLADQGLPAALTAQARKAALPVQVHADGLGRYPQEVEAAVYFSVLEALQNVAKYAGATSATVTVSAEDGVLRFGVRDDGRGFEPASTGYGTGLRGMADRLEALGGQLSISSAPGAGTTVAGELPILTVPHHPESWPAAEPALAGATS